MNEEFDASGWIPNSELNRPKHPNLLVRVRLRCGLEKHGQVGVFDWADEGYLFGVEYFQYLDQEPLKAPPVTEHDARTGLPISGGTSALDVQVAGSHYKDCKIQPIEFIHANNLDFFQGNIVKYTTRHKTKNGAADLQKVIHYAQLALELQYGIKP